MRYVISSFLKILFFCLCTSVTDRKKESINCKEKIRLLQIDRINVCLCVEDTVPTPVLTYFFNS